MSEEIYKTCRRCGRTLPIEQFHSNNSSPDGHKIYCRECSAEMAKESAARRKERNAPQTMGGGVTSMALSPLSNLVSLLRSCAAEVIRVN